MSAGATILATTDTALWQLHIPAAVMGVVILLGMWWTRGDGGEE